jgi:hypothetical protein
VPGKAKRLGKRAARRIAVRLAYEAVQKAVDGGGNEGATEDDQMLIDAELDAIAQRMFERWMRLKGDEDES